MEPAVKVAQKNDRVLKPNTEFIEMYKKMYWNYENKDIWDQLE